MKTFVAFAGFLSSDSTSSTSSLFSWHGCQVRLSESDNWGHLQQEGVSVKGIASSRMFRSASDLIYLSMQTVFGNIGARMSGGLSSLQSAKNFAVQMWGGGPESRIWLMFSFSCFASSNGFFGRSRLARPLLACHNLSGHDLATLVLNAICNPKRAIQYMKLG